MGQKSRNKKNRPAKSHNKPSASQVASTAPVAQKASILQGGATPVSHARPAAASVRSSLLEHMEYVRADIVRILQLLVILALILVGLTLLNAKTSVLQKAGLHLSNFMRLQ